MFNELNLEEFKEIIKSDKPILIDFYGKHCPQCKIIAPILEELSSKMKDKLGFYKFDINQDLEVAKEYNIQSLPTIIIFKEGKTLNVRTGSGSKKIIQDWINEKI